eukprot:1186329-Prorocentrum_minimum.AAC.2
MCEEIGHMHKGHARDAGDSMLMAYDQVDATSLLTSLLTAVYFRGVECTLAVIVTGGPSKTKSSLFASVYITVYIWHLHQGGGVRRLQGTPPPQLHARAGCTRAAPPAPALRYTSLSSSMHHHYEANHVPPLCTVHLDSVQSAHEGEVRVQLTGNRDTIGAYS